jgi:adenylosuccinate synthase
VAYEVDGRRVDEVPHSQSDFHHAKPIYEMLPGWSEDITKAQTFEDLPKNAQSYVKALEDLSRCRISAIGVGPGRTETIQVHSLL